MIYCSGNIDADHSGALLVGSGTPGEVGSVLEHRFITSEIGSVREHEFTQEHGLTTSELCKLYTAFDENTLSGGCIFNAIPLSG